MKKKPPQTAAEMLQHGAAVWADTYLAPLNPLAAMFIKDVSARRIRNAPFGAEPRTDAENIRRCGVFIVGLTKRGEWTGTILMTSGGERERDLLMRELGKLPRLEAPADSANAVANLIWDSGGRIVAALSISTDAKGTPFYHGWGGVSIPWVYALYFLQDAWTICKRTN